MGKVELALIVKRATGCTHNVSSAVIDEIIDSIKSEALAGRQVVLKGFGTFRLKTRQPRNIRNIHTNGTIRTKGYTMLGFRASDKTRSV